MLGKRSLKAAARAGAAVAVAGAVAERARRTARSSGAAVATAGNTTGQAAKRIARSSGAAVATAGTSAGRAAKQIGKRVTSGFVATVRTAASDDDSVWADEEPGDHKAEATHTHHDALASLANETERAHQAKMTAARAAHEAGAEVSEIARAAGERRHTIRAWLADG